MGLFSKLLPRGSALHRLAQTCDECLNCIKEYEQEKNSNELRKAAWLFKYGVSDSIEKWNWNPFTIKIIIPNHPEIGGRIILDKIVMYITCIIYAYAEEEHISQEIGEILDGNTPFNFYSYLIPTKLKNKLNP